MNNNNAAAAMSDCLKRKRPPKIEIPCGGVLSEIMDADPPCRRMCFSGDAVALFSRKGNKAFMEDTHNIISSSLHKREFFGVYDGHGGYKAAQFVAEKLQSYMFEMMDHITTKEKAIEMAYLKTDAQFLKQGLGSGACCVTALIEGKEMIISNLGDCRAVLCTSGIAEALTTDHKAAREDERKRIEDKGGYVELHRGGWRVHGVLSVSRSIGDAHLKDWVSAEPDTKTLILTQDMEYLVLASDGLWDQVGNQEAMDLIMQSCAREKKMQLPVAIMTEKADEFCCESKSPSSKLRRVSIVKSNRKRTHSPSCAKIDKTWMSSEDKFGNENESPPTKARQLSNMSSLKKKAPDRLVAACRELVNLAVSRGSCDDITVMIIDLSHFKS